MRPDVYFTDFEREDFPVIYEIWKETGLAAPERGDDADTILRCNSLGGKFINMRLKGTAEIIGTSWMTYDGRRIFLHHFCIKPEYQGKGLGYLLGKESFRFIKKNGSQVKLEVHKGNIKAKRLYEKLGFFAFRDYDIYMIRKPEEGK